MEFPIRHISGHYDPIICGITNLMSRKNKITVLETTSQSGTCNSRFVKYGGSMNPFKFILNFVCIIYIFSVRIPQFS